MILCSQLSELMVLIESTLFRGYVQYLNGKAELYIHMIKAIYSMLKSVL